MASNVKIEEISTEDDTESESDDETQGVHVAKNAISNAGMQQIDDQISNIGRNADFVSVLGRENAADVINAMSNLLKIAKPTTSLPEVIQQQGSLFPAGRETDWIQVLQNCPKEIWWIGIPCFTFLMWKSGDTLFYLMGAVLFMFSVAKIFSYLESSQKTHLTAANKEMQIRVMDDENKLGVEVFEKLGQRAQEIQTVQANLVVAVTKLSKESVDNQLLALSQLRTAEMNGRIELAKLKEEGATGREQMIQDTKKNLAEVSAAIEKCKAELLKQSKLEIAQLKAEQTKLKEEAAKEIVRIQTNAQMEIEKMTSEAKERSIQFQTDQAARQRAHEDKLQADKLRSDAEMKAKEVTAKRDADLKRIDAEMSAATERTRQIEIQEKYKTEREKPNCSIM